MSDIYLVEIMDKIHEKIPIEVSNRHVHLSVEDSERLFGKGKRLTSFKELSQTGQFASNELVTLINGDRKIESVRAVGPERKESQVELSRTDARYLGIDASVRLSGDLADTPGLTIQGSQGEAQLQKGVIVAQRHLHCSPEEADELGIKHEQDVSIKVSGERSAILYNVQVRVDPSFCLALHLDTDEGNALGVNKGDVGSFWI